MFAYNKMLQAPHAYPFRWTARASAAVLFGIWVTLFTCDISRLRFDDLAMSTYSQGAALLVVFAGYLIGLRQEFVGGITAILGTIAFMAIVLSTTYEIPGVAGLLFALPGVLYLLAWRYDERRQLRL